MGSARERKIDRLLYIYTKLVNGYTVSKRELSERFGVNTRSIQRDIDRLRSFLAEPDDTGTINSIIYDREEKGFRLEKTYQIKFTNSEILAICKILLDSRAFTKDEMASLLDRLINGCVPKSNQALVKNLIRNEEYHYIEPRHGSTFIRLMWSLGEAIQTSRLIEITYHKLKDQENITRVLQPVAIMFSEYYFYLAAFINDHVLREEFDLIGTSTPTIYRIDRIDSLRVLDEHFHIPYRNRFEEGEFRKRIQFMTGGKLKRIRFDYSGLSIEAILDRLPTAKILNEDDGIYTIQAEAYGNGIDMWLRAQGEAVSNIIEL